MRYEDLKVFNVSELALEANPPGSRGFTPRLAECVLLSDLPQKIPVSEWTPDPFKPMLLYWDRDDWTQEPEVGYYSSYSAAFCRPGIGMPYTPQPTHVREILW